MCLLASGAPVAIIHQKWQWSFSVSVFWQGITLMYCRQWWNKREQPRQAVSWGAAGSVPTTSQPVNDSSQPHCALLQHEIKSSFLHRVMEKGQLLSNLYINRITAQFGELNTVSASRWHLRGGHCPGVRGDSTTSTYYWHVAYVTSRDESWRGKCCVSLGNGQEGSGGRERISNNSACQIRTTVV